MATEVEKKPALDPALVQEFVGVAHADLARVQELLGQEPQLLNASNDWGGGDWETGLGAASHMGRRDIALFLIEKGAPVDVFAATMLGYLDVVRSILALHPDLKSAPGPHGIPLVAHAKAGGEGARQVLEYLAGS